VACGIPRPAAGLPAGPSGDGTADAGIFRAPALADPTPDPYEVLDRLARLLRERSALEENLGRACLLLRRSGAFRGLGFARFDEYCADRLGLAPSTVRQRVALERRMQDLPALREALRSGRLSYEQARLVARVATPSDVAARIEEAAARTCIAYRRELEGEEHRQMWRAGELRAMVPDEVESLLEDAIRSARASVRGLTLGEALVVVALHFIRTWKGEIERRLRAVDPVILRDDALCQVPGCSRPADHVHHVVSRAARGALEPWNEISLCAVHHLRGVHGGNVRIIGTAPGGLAFTLGEREVAAARA
jgi:ribosomal protein L22